MTEIINIPIKRTGFPVKIGEVELWFDSSVENVRNFLNIEEIAEEKLEKVRKKSEHIHFPTEINDETIKDVKVEDIDTAFDANKEFIAIQYDLIFGDGTFKKLYKAIPDIIALDEVLEVVGISIAERLEEQNKEITKRYTSKRDEILNKKKQKQGD